MIEIYDLRDGLLFERVSVEKFKREYYADYVSGRLMAEGLCVQVENNKK